MKHDTRSRTCFRQPARLMRRLVPVCFGALVLIAAGSLKAANGYTHYENGKAVGSFVRDRQAGTVTHYDYKTGTKTVTDLKNPDVIDTLKRGEQFWRQHDMDARYKSKATGAITRGTVRAKATQAVARKTVARSLASRLLAGARLAKVGGLPGAALSIGAEVLYNMYNGEIESQGYKYDKDRDAYVSTKPYVIECSPIGGETHVCGELEMIVSSSAAEMQAQKCQDYPIPKGFEDYQPDGWKPSAGYDGTRPAMSGFCDMRKGSNLRWYMSTRVVKNERVLTQDELADMLDPMITEGRTQKTLETLDKDNAIGQAWKDAGVSVGEDGSGSGGTVLDSDPYTDPRTGKAQQSRFRFTTTDGKTTVKEEITPRPDLEPNSKDAPAAQPDDGDDGGRGGSTSGKDGDRDKDGSKDKAKDKDGTKPDGNGADFCKDNPQAAMCKDLGQTDYQDPVIPTQQIRLSLNPVNIFRTEGSCPAPKSFTLPMLGTFSVDYGMLCYTARLLRPILILGTMITCAFFAYAAVKEL